MTKKLIKCLILLLAFMNPKIDALKRDFLEDFQSNIKEYVNKDNMEDTELSVSEAEELKNKNFKKIKDKYLLPSLIFINQLNTEYENVQSENKLKVEYKKFNSELFNNLKKIKSLGRGAQGSAYLCENIITHKKYVIKKTVKESISCTRTIYEEFPEFLACEKLKDFKCEYITKPLAYRQISNDSAEILLEYAENNVNLDSLTIKEKKEVLKQILFARKQLQKIRLLHGDICGKNFNIERKTNGNIAIHIYDYGYFSEIKDSYSKKDVIMYMHPFIDVQQIYKSIKCIFNGKSIKTLDKKIQSELPALSSIISRDTWWWWNRRRHASKILKISLDDCNKLISIIEKWVDEINA